MSNMQLDQTAEVFHVDSSGSLQDAISKSKQGDTIVIGRHGDYGDIRIINKSGIRLTANTKQLNIQATISIDGASNNVIVENLNLWNSNHSKRQIIFVGKQSEKIIIRHCIISSLPVSMNNWKDKPEGAPGNWINGIRILGKACDVNNNILANIKLGICVNGTAGVIRQNRIQYFSQNAIRANHNDARVLKNTIYDAIASGAGDADQSSAIQIIPTDKRLKGGAIKNVEIMENTIRSQSQGTSVPPRLQGILQGITASDGYFEDLTISANTLVLNSDHGITLNGVRNLHLNDNKVIASPTQQQYTPGIKLYLCRISSSSGTERQWLANKHYSVFYGNNQAPVFNLPGEAYEANDQGGNRFACITHDLAPDDEPDILRRAVVEPAIAAAPEANVSKPVPPPALADAKATSGSISAVEESIPTVSSRASLSATTSEHAIEQVVHPVSNATELNAALKAANPGDTILITRSGDYGTVSIYNKSELRVKSFNTDIPIRANFIIDGSSNRVILENMQIWNDDPNKQCLIISGKTTQNIAVRNCILSSVRVNRTTMRQGYGGNPQHWTSGIRMLGSNGQIFSNYMMNLKFGVLECGPNTLIQYNLVQFYAEDAIRASNHGVRILHNNIYDAVAAHPGQNAHKDAIQLIPPHNRYNGGHLQNIHIIGNIIQSFTHPAVVPPKQRGIVQGIFGSDGYFLNTVIRGNTVMVNSDHGITFNGLRNAEISENRIMDLTNNEDFNPGIKLYLTRIRNSNGEQQWLGNRPYSVRLRGNQAPALNLPDSTYYSLQDLGGNQFKSRTILAARDRSPLIIRAAGDSSDGAPVTPPPLPVPGSQADTGNPLQTYAVNNAAELERALKLANSGDTVVIKQGGKYGQIRITNKENLRIHASDPNAPINANFLIDGNSSHISIERMNLWFSERNWKPVILSGPATRFITVRNCLISSAQVSRTTARLRMVASPHEWVNGIWLRGDGNEITNNHIVNVKAAITAGGANCLIQNNLIQYFADAGIRVMNDNMEIVHNNVYDAIASAPGCLRLLTGIQLIPAKDRFSGGAIKNIKMNNNTVQAKNSGSPTAVKLQGCLQGITLHDGYVSGIVVNSNTIIVNSEHGITLNGVSGLSLNGNKVFDSRPGDNYVPGIRLYFTRTIDIDGDRVQTWRTNRNYSVTFSNNMAAIFNVPDIGYEINDGGENHFRVVTRNRARGMDPLFAP